LISNFDPKLGTALDCLVMLPGKHLENVYRYFPPPKPYVLHSEALAFYRKGRVAEALRDWTRLDQYGPANLSRASHAIYVQQPHDTKEGLRILRCAVGKGKRHQVANQGGAKDET
jgi:hypothetical protein